MAAPCTCNLFTRGSVYTTDQCRLCWLYHHVPAAKAHWDALSEGKPSPVVGMTPGVIGLAPAGAPAQTGETPLTIRATLVPREPAPIPFSEMDVRGKPGSALKKVLASIDIYPLPGCPCLDDALQMDLWGLAGCREQREEIIRRLRANQTMYGLGALLKAGWRAIRTGLAAKLDPLDPFPGLVDEAISLAAGED